MAKKYFVIVAFLSIIVLVIGSCDLIPPQNALRLYDAPSYTDIGSGIIRISFRLYNSGSDALQNCKVRWYVDDSFSDPPNLIEFDQITGWAPALGVDLAAGEISGTITVDTTSGILGVVEYFGVYAWGWDNPPDE